MAWLNTDVPHWLTAKVQQHDPTQEVIAAMRFGADQKQRNLDNAFRLKEFGAQQESRNLQNTLVQMRIDADANDSRALSEWLPKFNAATGDDLRSLPLPSLKDASRLEGVQQMISRKLDAEATSLSNRLLNSTRLYNLKTLDSLDPALRQPIMPHLGANGLLDDEGVQLLQSAVESQRHRDIEAKPTASMQDIELAGKLRTDAAKLRAAGDEKGAQNAEYQLSLIEGKMLGPTEIIETTPEGVRITKGGRGSTDLTMGVRGKLQEQLHNYDDAMNILTHISKNMNASDFGLRGVSKEMWAKIGGQFGADVKPESLDVRDNLRLLRAHLYKSLRSDSNITEPERKQIEAMLPSERITESLPSAIASLNAVKNVLAGKARNAAKALNQPTPTWATNLQDVVGLVKQALAAGKITEEKAIEAIKKFDATGEVPQLP